MITNEKSTIENKNLKMKRKRRPIIPLNDGMNTPVPDSAVVKPISQVEAALFKQAENPLGNPNEL